MIKFSGSSTFLYMGVDHPIEMVLLIFICLFGLTTTSKGASFTIKTNKYLSNFGPLLQKFHNQIKFLVLTSNVAKQVQIRGTRNQN